MDLAARVRAFVPLPYFLSIPETAEGVLHPRRAFLEIVARRERLGG